MSGVVLSEFHETLRGRPLPLSLTELPIMTLDLTGQPTDSVSRPESWAASDGRAEGFAAKGLEACQDTQKPSSAAPKGPSEECCCSSGLR